MRKEGTSQIGFRSEDTREPEEDSGKDEFCDENTWAPEDASRTLPQRKHMGDRRDFQTPRAAYVTLMLPLATIRFGWGWAGLLEF